MFQLYSVRIIIIPGITQIVQASPKEATKSFKTVNFRIKCDNYKLVHVTSNDQLRGTMEALHFKEDHDSLSSKIKKHNTDLDNLYDATNDMEQNSKNNDTEIKGILKPDDENCKAIVKKIGQFVACTITDEALDGCHRLRQPRNLILTPAIVECFVRR
ncbi:hypothetical protein PR048_011170 [Dryococelus australis]|uniref:Uncharacterized protein n=1 Tax=Dryococelus australis TaxID=614101 RepID=A0ABQ9HKU2_9NEOP|nr:hypothetical protein PR048_011170 [Dryococelus australis]